MKLENKKVAVLATDGFEKSELFEPYKALKKEGAQVDIVSIKTGKIKSWDKTDWGKSIDVDKLVNDTNQSEYNALVLPGGVINPDSLRTDENALEFIRSFFKNNKPVAAICHAPWLLISADVIENREVTSYKSIKSDVLNAGATWVDKEVVVDSGLVTSRNPEDLPAFINKMIEEINEGKHTNQVAKA
ncbi:type 1 glutamine amidotransferase [Cellulophaga baltica]|uniref:type 1 glutamine amidotransferase domain-containing protein n=1 Tax=Cellulophaga TaxID=104264 RepID=UPI001C07B5B9|nr:MULTISPECIES: type 1 glutamine amidotransferase domain-containing protein [Cellulophaga]MBU2997705.1 type 1 glutamine amidotransferase [Cellulophaga baltica]MDO6769100.1 type 1 glutamine amidotransferase domain-containing protein [Cellulophaga sp. 1_MG-2023]